jgi:hypothetical protein
VAVVVLALLVCAVLSGTPCVARAFTEPRSYADDPANGGGGGRWFTGSPAEGHACSVCHSGPPSETLKVEGLPEDGYVPGAVYDLRLSWEDFADRADALREAGEGPPSTGLVAELVAESGQGAGILELSPAPDAEPGELCQIPEGVQAAQLFRVRPGEPTREEALSCEAEGLGQRCLVAVLSCGARELRVRWTAPEGWQGPIWFAAGFVATEEVSGDPYEDAVTEIAQPLLPAASNRSRYEQELEGGCGVVRGGGVASAAGLPILPLALLWWRRARRRSGGAR